MTKILVPLPSYGVDPTEVAIPWETLSQAGCDFAFATPTGSKAVPDSAMLNGEGLGIWRNLLQTRKDAVLACEEMQRSEAFCAPIEYHAANARDYDALLLPGGHDKGVKEYLESPVLQSLVVDFFNSGKPVAAICHGVVLAARSIDPVTGQSVLHNYQTTALLKTQEMAAYNMTRLWLKDYYLTYPGLTVEDEVRSVLNCSESFVAGPKPLFRDSPGKLGRGFTVQDRNYLSSRWPGDAYSFSLAFQKMLDIG